MSDPVTKHVDEARTFVVGLFCFGGRRSFFLFTFLPLLERDLVMLIKVHGREKNAGALMRGELKVLDLNGCEIGDDGAVTVAAFIKVDDTVERVYLYGCNIGPSGAKAIADAVKRNQKLRILGLGNNQIGHEGADAFIDALRHNVSITELYVNYNNIAPESWAAIEYLTQTRNRVLIPAAVRRASLYLIAARRATPIADAGDFAIFPKEIVRMIAMAVWATRKDPKWIEAVK
jgi:hypothetical protein